MWACQQAAIAVRDVADFCVVSGDASFRRYYRLTRHDGGSLIVVSAPPDKENNTAFVNVRALLAGGGVHVPELLGYDAERGFLLLSDFGDRLLLDELSDANVDRWYGIACAELQAIQRVDASALPAYDAAALQREMLLFDQWFAGDLLGAELDAAEAQMLQRLRDWLCAVAAEQPAVLVHRDYHSRNLMLLDDSEIGVIDFQDACCGPLTYDLVSLLRDCYVRWPADRVRRWALEYRDRLQGAGMLAPIDDAGFLRWFDLMGLQRHLKVLGIFARLYLRDGKPGYLDDLPLVLHYTLEVARQYPQAQGLVELIEQRLMPAIKQQTWWRPL